MTLQEARAELEKFVRLKTTQRPSFVDVLLNATADRKHGEWIDDNCSICGQYVYHGDIRYYCPNCGAKMDEVEP